jgi:hypothetical protein
MAFCEFETLKECTKVACCKAARPERKSSTAAGGEQRLERKPCQQ